MVDVDGRIRQCILSTAKRLTTVSQAKVTSCRLVLPTKEVGIQNQRRSKVRRRCVALQKGFLPSGLSLAMCRKLYRQQGYIQVHKPCSQSKPPSVRGPERRAGHANRLMEPASDQPADRQPGNTQQTRTLRSPRWRGKPGLRSLQGVNDPGFVHRSDQQPNPLGVNLGRLNAIFILFRGFLGQFLVLPCRPTDNVPRSPWRAHQAV